MRFLRLTKYNVIFFFWGQQQARIQAIHHMSAYVAMEHAGPRNLLLVALLYALS